MTTHQALQQLGVREDTLSRDEKDFLDREGYLHLSGILAREQVDRINRRLAELLEEEAEDAGKEVHQEAGTDRLADLVNKGAMFHVVLTQPRVLAAIARVLEDDLKLSSLNSRAALPGQGLQVLHADYNDPPPSGTYHVCNSIWLLDDFTQENGATRVVPGSHRSGTTPQKAMPDPKAPHPQEKLLLGRAGDVVVFNAHTWHGGTLNRTDKPRRAVHGYFTRRALEQQLDQQKFLRKETWEQLSPAARFILGVDPL